MDTNEINSAEMIEDQVFYGVAVAINEDGEIWFHVVEWNEVCGYYVSIYRAANFEDAQDVLSIYI